LRGFQVSSCDGGVQLVEFMLPVPTEWGWESFSASQIDQQLAKDRMLLVLQQQVKALQMQQAQAVDLPASEAARSMNRAIEELNAEIDDYRAQVKQNMLGVWPATDKSQPGATSYFGFSFRKAHNAVALLIPYWCVILISGAAAAILATRKHLRFSLRTMLIATTLVAVTLGMVAAVKR
jgi:hypothetical protein